ncbi:hypothetical protein BS50DRAFT_629498 [Corynespora cassiicola Philippines]|uniref:Uncharacterized protein n=1 Tax=Corynespora cassiicola Philippines TaxID=1448308 RepID=A0A2T2P786_CORCC|nr:hypothetical protein BS50DRAFT_629498 [Corynespora cassiicola Philippines]
MSVLDSPTSKFHTAFGRDKSPTAYAMVQRMKIEGEGGELAELEQLIYDDVSRRHPSTSNSIAYNFSSYHSTVKHVIASSSTPPLMGNVDYGYFSTDETTHISVRDFPLVDDEEVDAENGATTKSNKSHVDGRDIIFAEASEKDRIGSSNEDDDTGSHKHDYANAPISEKWEILGDDGSSPVIGKVDPKKLLVQLRNKRTGALVQYEHGRGRMSEIDWNNQNDINAIIYWRRKLLEGADTAPRELYMPIITTQELEEYKSEGLLRLNDPRAPSKHVAFGCQRRKNCNAPEH